MRNLKPMVMTHMQSRHTSVGCWLKAIYTEAFRRIGYRLEYQHIPAKRANRMAVRGLVDGELGRTESYGRHHPELVRIEEPHLTEQFSIYGLYHSPIVSWEDVRQSGLMVGIRRGIQTVEENIVGKIQKDRITMVDRYMPGLQMLARKRIDLFIGPSRVIDTLLVDEYLSKSGIQKIGVVNSHNAHAYLHQRHRTLSVPLSRVLRQLKAEGFLKNEAANCGLRH